MYYIYHNRTLDSRILRNDFSVSLTISDEHYACEGNGFRCSIGKAVEVHLEN